MSIHAGFRFISLLTASACLVLAYTLAGYWPIAFTIPAMGIYWFVAKKWSPFWGASSLLAIYLVFSVIGVSLKLSVPVIVMGCIAALAAWDLNDLGLSLAGDAAANGKALLEKRHMQSLAMVVGISLFLTAFGSQLHLQLPFGLVVLLALLVTGCTVLTVQYLITAGAEAEPRN